MFWSRSVIVEVTPHLVRINSKKKGSEEFKPFVEINSKNKLVSIGKDVRTSQQNIVYNIFELDKHAEDVRTRLWGIFLTALLRKHKGLLMRPRVLLKVDSELLKKEGSFFAEYLSLVLNVFLQADVFLSESPQSIHAFFNATPLRNGNTELNVEKFPKSKIDKVWRSFHS